MLQEGRLAASKLLCCWPLLLLLLGGSLGHGPTSTTTAASSTTMAAMLSNGTTKSIIPEHSGGGADARNGTSGSGGADGADHDLISLEVGPAGALSTTGSAKARRFRAEMRVRMPKAAVWRVITDYDNLSNVLPNMPVSRRVPLPEDGSHRPGATGRVYQEGEQRLFGWKIPMLISTGVTLDFEEDEAEGVVRAYLVESALLAEYTAEWRLVEEEVVEADSGTVTVTTRMYYSGVACPKGPVPQRLVEWQLRKDVPTNLRALKQHAEAQPWPPAPASGEEEEGEGAEESEPGLASSIPVTRVAHAGAGKEEGGQQQQQQQA